MLYHFRELSGIMPSRWPLEAARWSRWSQGAGRWQTRSPSVASCLLTRQHPTTSCSLTVRIQESIVCNIWCVLNWIKVTLDKHSVTLGQLLEHCCSNLNKYLNKKRLIFDIKSYGACVDRRITGVLLYTSTVQVYIVPSCTEVVGPVRDLWRIKPQLWMRARWMKIHVKMSSE